MSESRREQVEHVHRQIEEAHRRRSLREGDEAHPSEGSEQEPRPRMNLQKIETWVDQAIQQAQRRGDFDDLPGAGKPLKGIEHNNDPDWWVKGLIERERLDMSDALPGPLALRRERNTFPESLLALRDGAAVREALEDFNQRVLEDRRRPHFGPGSPVVVGRVDVEAMVERWRELRAGMPSAAEAVAGLPEQHGPTEERTRRRRWWRWVRGRS